MRTGLAGTRRAETVPGNERIKKIPSQRLGIFVFRRYFREKNQTFSTMWGTLASSRAQTAVKIISGTMYIPL